MVLSGSVDLMCQGSSAIELLDVYHVIRMSRVEENIVVSISSWDVGR